MQSYASGEGNHILCNSEDTVEIVFLFGSKLKETGSDLGEFGYRLITGDFEDPVLELATNLCEIVSDTGNYIFFFIVGNGIGIGIGIDDGLFR